MILIFDIETDRHTLVPAPETDEDRCPAAPHHRIVAAAGVVLEERRDNGLRWCESTRAVTFGGEAEPDERSIVEHIVKAMRNEPKIITWNGAGFDLRVIHAACLEHGIQCPYLASRDVNYRYSAECHDDAMDRFSCYGAGRRAQQDAYARRIGLPGKMGVDGSQVAKLAEQGKWSDIRAYNGQDTGQLGGVWLRDEYVGGRLTLDGYRLSAASLVGLMERTPALEPIVRHERFDRKKFLLEEV